MRHEWSFTLCNSNYPKLGTGNGGTIEVLGLRKRDKKSSITAAKVIVVDPQYSKAPEAKEIYIGDIIINLNQLYPKKPYSEFKRNLNVVFIHGLIHLFGYDHKRLKDFKDMHKLEKLYLKYLD